ncbi:hypothetical protein [Pseudochryseolinea flava]|uniref:Uncharacterized protein n=1 Tax=Pseudochryseolinea flava TaxID=2059302 RepID=A0A364Y8N7_9BACT|nr:hypothetical protein [Pseudochryseolinea flava]RAW03476.1 hypothetical protein DQQ10_05170 [Pseudochryseolinea flava]
MKTFKKIASKWYVSGVIALALFITSCQSPESKRSQVSSATGEELFIGLFFGEGKVAAMVPELYERSQLKNYLTSEAEIAAFKKFQQQAIQVIGESNPLFFKSFKRDITSGDHLRISAALKRSSAVLVRTIESMYGVKENDFLELTQQLKSKTNFKEVVLSGSVVNRGEFKAKSVGLL